MCIHLDSNQPARLCRINRNDFQWSCRKSNQVIFLFSLSTNQLLISLCWPRALLHSASQRRDSVHVFYRTAQSAPTLCDAGDQPHALIRARQGSCHWVTSSAYHAYSSHHIQSTLIYPRYPLVSPKGRLLLPRETLETFLELEWNTQDS